MSELWIFIVVGLTAGGAYALASIGVVTVYRGSGVLNFAHGAIGMAGTYVFWSCYEDGAATHGLSVLARWPVAPAIAAGILAGAAIGFLVYIVVMYPLRNASELARVIATLGVLLVIQHAALLIYSAENNVIPRFLGQGSFDFFGAPFRYDSAIVLVVTILLAIGLSLLFRYTRLGLSAQALQAQPLAASTLGISPHPVGLITWMLGGALAAAGGILVVPSIGLSPTKLTLLINYALAASLLGRYRRYGVTVAAALAMGIAESVMILHSVSDWIRLTTPLVVILVALLLGGTAVPGRGFAESRLPRVGSGKVRPLQAAFWLGVAAFLVLGASSGWSISVTNAAIAALVSLSVVIVTGYAGQISLATFGIMGIGALLSAHTVSTWGMGYEAALVVGLVGGAVVGGIVGLPAIRVRGIDLTVATMGFGIIVSNAILIAPTFLGGASRRGFDGLVVPPPELFGIDVDPTTHIGRFAALCLTLLVLVGVGVANLRRSGGGRRLLAVRANERGAAALGLSVGGAKVAAFALGGAVAGLAGALTVFRTRNVTFTAFDVFRSIFVLAFTIVSGVGYVAGAIYTGAIATGGIASYLFRNVSGDVDQLLAIGSGLFVIHIMLQSPDGIIPLMSMQADAIRRRVRRGATRRRVPEPIETTMTPAPTGRPEAGTVQLLVDGLEVRYGIVRAVDGVSLDVAAGRILGVIGPNGAGKTTLIDAITGFCRQTSGSIVLAGDDVGRWSIRRRARAGLGRTFQNLELFSDLSVRENLLAATDTRGPAAFLTGWIRPGSTRLTGAAADAAVLLGLRDVLDTKITELPQGTQRLVAVARALAARPLVLCLDEPAAGLSESERVAMRTAIRAVVDELHIGVLLVEHNVDVVAGLCDEVVVLDFGKVIAAGPPAEVLASDVVRRAYLGTAGETKMPAPEEAPV